MLKILIFLCKRHIWENSFTGVIAGKSKSCQSVRLNELISLIVCIWTNNQKRRAANLIFLVRCLVMPRYIQNSTWAQRISGSCSFTENSIEWKIKQKEKSWYTFFVHTLSQQILLPSQIPGFIDQPDIWKKSLNILTWVHIGRCSVGVSKKEKHSFWTLRRIRSLNLAGIGGKWK